jgi:hypothetical protein
MTLRCDHCRRPLGLVVRRYWHMRFCSAGCTRAYQRRLRDDTKQKIVKIVEPEGGAHAAPRLIDRLFGSRPMSEPNRRLAGKLSLTDVGTVGGAKSLFGR